MAEFAECVMNIVKVALQLVNPELSMIRRTSQSPPAARGPWVRAALWQSGGGAVHGDDLEAPPGIRCTPSTTSGHAHTGTKCPSRQEPWKHHQEPSVHPPPPPAPALQAAVNAAADVRQAASTRIAELMRRLEEVSSALSGHPKLLHHVALCGWVGP